MCMFATEMFTNIALFSVVGVEPNKEALPADVRRMTTGNFGNNNYVVVVCRQF